MQSNSVRLSHLKEVLRTLEEMLGEDGEVTVEVRDWNNVLFRSSEPGSSDHCYAYSRIVEDHGFGRKDWSNYHKGVTHKGKVPL